MPFTAYFDGGNQADSTQYKIVTLASFSGSEIQWRNFEKQWQNARARHGAPPLHTTDAAGLTRDFSRRKGWDEARRDAFIADCASVIERCSLRQEEGVILVQGVRPHAVSIPLDDYKRAIALKPDIGTVEYNCAVQCCSLVFSYGVAVGATQYHFTFDQNEPFHGHVRDRVSNKKSRKHSVLWRSVASTTEADARNFPALQACDLLAWCINDKFNEGETRFSWQEKVLSVDRCNSWFPYERLINPAQGHIDLVKTFKLPPRRPNR